MKKLTVREKKMNAQVKKKLQEEGKIPPDKAEPEKVHHGSDR